MPCPILDSGRDAVRHFIRRELFNNIIPSGPQSINIERAFREFLRREGAPSGLADEYSERWSTVLFAQLEEELIDWEDLGVPRPVDIAGDGRTLVSWGHARFEEITGQAALSPEFIHIDSWISRLGEREFLVVPVLLLSMLGCRPILVTDTSGDGGIDVIGRLPVGILRSTMVCIQAKTSTGRIGREALLSEYGKFIALQRTEKFIEYKRALSLDRTRDGVGIAYLFVCNCEFKHGARGVAGDIGILLRSKKQLSHWLSGVISKQEAEMCAGKMGGLVCDLEHDLSQYICIESRQRRSISLG